MARWRLTAVLLLFGALVRAEDSLYGCSLDETLCTEAESCVQDGLFGQCQSEPHAGYSFDQDLSPEELTYLRLELYGLLKAGLKWREPRTQCVVAYFMFTMRYDLQYDPNFCNVRHPENVWALVQVVQERLRDAESTDYAEPDYDNTGLLPLVEGQLANDYIDGQAEDYPAMDQVIQPNVLVPEPEGDNRALLDSVVQQLMQEEEDNQLPEEPMSVVSQVDYPLAIEEVEVPQEPVQEFEVEAKRSGGTEEQDDSYRLNNQEEEVLNELLVRVMNGDEPDLSALSDQQLDKFISYVELMQRMLQNDEPGITEGEVEEANLGSTNTGDQSPFKKDTEQLGDADQGLSRTEHKIVKGKPKALPVQHWFHKIDGNRVYLRVDEDLTPDSPKLAELISFLEETIAKPKNLTFSDFDVQNNQVSFKVEPLTDDSQVSLDELIDPRRRSSSKRLAIKNEVPEQIYNQKKAIKKELDLDLSETGYGNINKRGDQDSIAVRSVDHESQNDVIVVPTLIVCGLLVGVLILLFGTYVYQNRNRARSHLKRFATDLEGRPSKAYEELCRQRMAGKGDGEPLAGVVNTIKQRLSSQGDSQAGPSQHSSTSSWSEEPVQTTNMDISTGHMILSYLEEHLKNKDKLDLEWNAVSAIKPDACATSEADKPENKAKNRIADVVPYDHARVWLQSAGTEGSGYINASTLCDHDPRSPVYIVTQAPLVSTAAEFWQMIWEQGSVVVVNLTKLAENGDSKCHRYWPENGSEIHGIFEVHLVSEHIWCEDYLVRSFYLKNLRTNETRTVTQFHFLNWPDMGVPPNAKPLLEFRRKVNKSYRGRSCPIVIHCSDGAGRSGTYSLLDMVLNRIAKGVKEIDIAATLEHLRDQRMKLVSNKLQYEFVLSCVAEEVQAVVKALPQQ